MGGAHCKTLWWFWVHQTGTGKSLSSLSLCPDQLGTKRQCHPWGGGSDPWDVPAVRWGCTGSPQASQSLAHSWPGGWAHHPSSQPRAGIPRGRAAPCQLGRDPAPCAGRQGPALPKSWRGAGKGSHSPGAAVLTHWGTRGPAPAKD